MINDVLIIDDEADIRNLISSLLKDEGYETRVARDGEEALEAFRSRRPHLIILDIWLNDNRYDGLKLLEIFKNEDTSVPVLMISGHGTIETAVSAIKKGAYDFIEKPFKAERLFLLVERALETAKLKRENLELKNKRPHGELIGVSSSIHHICHTIEKVAPTNSRIFITGPSGVGKEMIARLLHHKSKRSTGPFVSMHCALMSPEKLESELLGVDHLNSAGVLSHSVVGKFEKAHGGTLYLDEVTDMPLATQGKLVRILQEQSFTRVSGQKSIKVDVRVIASTTANLQEAMQNNRFREDLYYRLSVVPITVPSLKERKEDIPLFVQHFMEKAAQCVGLPPRKLSDDALAALQQYDWPGNVRQLYNVMEWILIMVPGSSSNIVSRDMLPPEILSKTPPALQWDKAGEIMFLPLREAREAFEKSYLMAQVSRFAGNISQTSQFVGMERSALHRKLKMLGVNHDRKSKGFIANGYEEQDTLLDSESNFEQ